MFLINVFLCEPIRRLLQEVHWDIYKNKKERGPPGKFEPTIYAKLCKVKLNYAKLRVNFRKNFSGQCQQKVTNSLEYGTLTWCPS